LLGNKKEVLCSTSKAYFPGNKTQVKKTQILSKISNKPKNQEKVKMDTQQCIHCWNLCYWLLWISNSRSLRRETWKNQNRVILLSNKTIYFWVSEILLRLLNSVIIDTLQSRLFRQFVRARKNLYEGPRELIQLSFGFRKWNIHHIFMEFL